MAESRNTDPNNAEAFRKAAAEGDIDHLEQLLLAPDAENLDTELREVWNEPVLPAQAKEVAEAFRSFESRIRPRRGARIVTLLRHAASVAAVIAIAVLWWQTQHPDLQVVETQWTECCTDYGQTRELTLADGTRLWVNAGSRVLYPSSFNGKERRVYISGEVCLSVAKDAEHPFYVTANGAEICVLGTEFNVKAYLNEQEVTTTLMSGSIEMRIPGNEEVYHLVPGKTLLYDRASGDIALFSTPEYNYPSWFRGEMNFHNETFRSIANDLERKFNVKIVIRSEELAAMRFYAGFVNNESVEEILEALNIQKEFRIVRKDHIIDIY